MLCTAGVGRAGQWMRSSISLPGLKVTTRFWGTGTRSPVLGLRAIRGARRLTLKTPKLRSSIRPSVANASMMALKVRYTTSLVSSWGIPSSSEIFLTISFLVTAHLLTQGRSLAIRRLRIRRRR